ncbi:hypothetical protein TeGR_g8538, partial [Tetraparma gracilis]
LLASGSGGNANGAFSGTLQDLKQSVRGKTPRFGNMMGDRSGARSPARSSSEKRSAGGASPKNTGVRKLGELRAAAK